MARQLIIGLAVVTLAVVVGVGAQALLVFEPQPAAVSLSSQLSVRPTKVGLIHVDDFAQRRAWTLGGTDQVVGEVEQPAPQALGSSARLLVVPVEFPSSQARPFTREQISQRIFSGPIQQFYQEQSYNRFTLTGEVAEWILVQRAPTNWACRAVDLDTPEIEQYLGSHNINLADYYGVIFLINVGAVDSAGSCATMGRALNNGEEIALAWVAFPASFISRAFPFTWDQFDHAVAHELGHNLGVYPAGAGHADALDCGLAILSTNCQHVEYGNHYDVMGLGTLATHFNAFYKEVLGWIKPWEMLTITQSGEYTIGVFELAGTQYHAAKIQVGDNFPFYLEYRQGIGFDANLRDANLAANQNGLMINRVLARSTPELLSARPSSTNWVGNVDSVSLNGNASFTDPTTGIVIGPIINQTSNSIRFRITMPGEAGYGWQDLF